MILKKKQFFLLIFLMFLQSCSGGKIGNFLESSFNDLEKISKDQDLQNKKILVKENKEINDKKIERLEKPKNIPENKKILVKENKNINDKKLKRLEKPKNVPENKKILVKENKEINVKKIKILEKPENVTENKKDINSEKIPKRKNNKIKKSTKKRNIDLQSYKIIFVLKDVDPKDPTEELSSILSNSGVNFEIEKIERILDSKNKTMNKN